MLPNSDALLLTVVREETTVVTDRESVQSLWENGAFGSSTRATFFKPKFLDNPKNNTSGAEMESLQLNPMETRHLNLAIAPVPRNWRLNFDSCCKAYSTLRNAGWVPKNGSQFGTDFVLYRESPENCHSSFCVTMVKEEHTILGLLRQLRAAEQTRKQLVLCDEATGAGFIKVKRWILRQEEPQAKKKRVKLTKM